MATYEVTYCKRVGSPASPNGAIWESQFSDYIDCDPFNREAAALAALASHLGVAANRLAIAPDCERGEAVQLDGADIGELVIERASYRDRWGGRA